MDEAGKPKITPPPELNKNPDGPDPDAPASDAPIKDEIDLNALDLERREKIEKIKKSLADGTYRISNEDVARKLIEHMREPKS